MIREDHERQINRMKVEGRFRSICREIGEVLRNVKLKLKDLPGLTVLRTYTTCELMVITTNCGCYVAIEYADHYDGYKGLEETTLTPSLVDQYNMVELLEPELMDEYKEAKRDVDLLKGDRIKRDRINTLLSLVDKETLREYLNEE